MTVSLPIPVVVTRHQCPHCRRTWSKPAAATAHIGRCWKNPAAAGCKTCAHFDQEPTGESCFPGRPCNCNDGYEQCGVGRDIDGGPAIHCPLWEAQK